MASVTQARTVRLGIRGFGGEIGDTITRSLMSMRRARFDAFAQVSGGSAERGANITAFIRENRRSEELDGTEALRNTIRLDRSFAKLRGTGSLTANTVSSYGYTDHIARTSFSREVPGRVVVAGKDGRTLNIDYRPIPSTNVDLPELGEIDFLIDATGVGLKKLRGEKDTQNPTLYTGYPDLTTFFSAPCKTVSGISHMLNGLGTRFHEVGQLNATGSCSTHAGVDLIVYLREGLIGELGIAEEAFIIEGGQFNATHSNTPSDNRVLPWYEAAYLAQTTGFGGAAGVVYPVPNIGNIDAATGRYSSYFIKDGVQANGTSMFSLALTISVPADSKEVTEEMIKTILLDAALDHEGKKHIGVVNPIFEMKTNKSTGIFTTLSMTGLTPTAILPLAGNISVVRLEGEKVLGETRYVQYIVAFKNVAYDNRLGFTADFLDEANLVARTRFDGQELIPGFHAVNDIGTELAFYQTEVGRALFSRALEETHGELLISSRP